MSHASGEIWNHSGRICGYFEYNGTVDFVCTRTYDTRKELDDNWRGDNMRECTCEATPKKVILYSSYGGGFHWPGEVCWHCDAIVSGFEPEDSIEGRPFEGIDEDKYCDKR